MELKSYKDLEKILNNKLKDNDYKGFSIIIFGSEKHLIKDGTKLLYETIHTLPELNIVKLEGEHINYNEVFNACETLPVMSDLRLVHLQNPQFLKKLASNEGEESKKTPGKGSEDLVDYLNSYIKAMAEGTILLITYDEEIDIRNRLLNSIKTNGYTLEYKPLRGEELSNYISTLFEKGNKKISKADLLYFISALGNSFDLMEKEIEKLCSYAPEEEYVTKKHIDECVHRGIENNIFKMVDNISVKSADKALTILNALLFQKEDPLRILGMIIRQYRILYLICLMTNQDKNFEEIKSNLKSKKINLVDFVLSNYIKQSRNYNSEDLREAISFCFEADNNIKTSKFPSELVLEILIMKLSK